MHVRDTEIKRLEQYAKGLGIIVEYKQPYKYGPRASWNASPPTIILHTYSGTSKTQLILNFLHELGHHMDYVHNHNRKTVDKIDNAWTQENNNEKLSKEDRLIIYNDEKSAASYRKVIAHELDLKVSQKKIDLDIDLDMFTYYTYYMKGNFPTRAETRAKAKELKNEKT